MSNLNKEFSKVLGIKPQNELTEMTVVSIGIGTVTVEKNGVVLTAAGNYQLGQRVIVRNGIIVGLASNPVREYVV